LGLCLGPRLDILISAFHKSLYFKKLKKAKKKKEAKIEKRRKNKEIKRQARESIIDFTHFISGLRQHGNSAMLRTN